MLLVYPLFFPCRLDSSDTPFGHLFYHLSPFVVIESIDLKGLYEQRM